MAKRGSSFGNLLIIGLVVFGISQCFKSPDTGSTTAAARTPATVPAPATTPVPVIPTVAEPAQTQAPAQSTTSVEVRFVTASSLNVRTSPGTNAEIVGKIPSGHQISVIEKDNGWLLIQSATVGRGWVSEQYTSQSRPVVAPPPTSSQAAVQANLPNRDQIIQQIIQRSIRNYSGNCPCPYNTTASGRRCGGNSAYSRPGGRSPICFPSDVSEAMIAAFRP